MMRTIHKLVALTTEGTPWALARFNDGEMRGVRGAGCTVARGHQKISESLRDHLIGALKWRADNYFIGVPCRQCWPTHRKLADDYVADYEHKTLAVVQTNRNLELMYHRFADALRLRYEVEKETYVIWVGSPRHNVTCLPFAVDQKINVPEKDAWSAYEVTYIHYRNFAPASVVFLSCGPMATVLAFEWFMERPDCTFIDIGSTYEPRTTGKEHRCHTGKLPACKECN